MIATEDTAAMKLKSEAILGELTNMKAHKV